MGRQSLARGPNPARGLCRSGPWQIVSFNITSNHICSRQTHLEMSDCFHAERGLVSRTLLVDDDWLSYVCCRVDADWLP